MQNRNFDLAAEIEISRHGQTRFICLRYLSHGVYRITHNKTKPAARNVKLHLCFLQYGTECSSRFLLLGILEHHDNVAIF